MNRLLPVLALAAGCLSRDPSAPVSSASKPAPTGVAAAGAYVVVLDSGAVYGTETTYRPGSVVVIDPSTTAIVNRIPTTAKDPVYALATATDLFVVAPGPLQGPEHTLAEDGALDVFAVADLATSRGPTCSVRFKGGGKPALVGTRLFVGSATSGDVFELDVALCKLVRTVAVCTPHDLNTTAVAALGGQVLAVCFDSDTLTVLDPESGAPMRPPIDLKQDVGGDLEGPIDLAVCGDGGFPDVLVALSIAPLVASIDSRTWTVSPRWSVGGSLGNRVVCAPPFAYLTSSGDNAVHVLDRTTGAEVEAIVFAPGCGPWETAIAFGRAWVTLNACGKVGVVDLGDSKHVTILDL